MTIRRWQIFFHHRIQSSKWLEWRGEHKRDKIEKQYYNIMVSRNEIKNRIFIQYFTQNGIEFQYLREGYYETFEGKL